MSATKSSVAVMILPFRTVRSNPEVTLLIRPQEYIDQGCSWFLTVHEGQFQHKHQDERPRPATHYSNRLIYNGIFSSSIYFLAHQPITIADGSATNIYSLCETRPQKSMLYTLLANFVLVIHGLFVALVVFGGLLVLSRPKLAWLHIPALAWGATIITMGWICPLTPLENTLRHMAGQQGYDGGFIEYYLLSIIYPQGLTRQIQIVLATLLIIGNAAIYAALIYRFKKPISRRKTKGDVDT